MTDADDLGTEMPAPDVEGPPLPAAPSLESRRLAARLKREAAEKQLNANAEEAAVEREELEAENAAALAAAVARHGKLGVKIDTVPIPGGRIAIVTRAHPATYKRLTELETISFEESEKFVRPCVVHPSPADWDIASGEAPAIVITATAKIGALMGMRRTELASK